MRTMARGSVAVQQEIIAHLVSTVDELFERPPEEWTVASAEHAVCALFVEFCRLVLGGLLAHAARTRATAFADKHFGSNWRFRLDKGYDARVETTVGTVTFPLFALRAPGPDGQEKTYTPAKPTLLPYYASCRSSPALLEWTCILGSTMPFRQAQTALTRFTRGAVTIEDTTIARHTVAIGAQVDRPWLYRPREEMRRIVAEQATRCRDTGRPLVYVSCDAHSLRRYVDETWEAEWKMLNGIRVWCIDRDTGKILHLGGEYTWGDCREVAAMLKVTMAEGYLPSDGDFGDGADALYVWLSDGMPWFDDHLLPLFDPDALLVVLDAYHVLERLSCFVKAFHRRSKRAASVLYRTLAVLIAGAQRRASTPAAPRCGHRKRRTKPARPAPEYPAHDGFLDYAAMLLHQVKSIPAKRAKRRESLDTLIAYLEANAHRIDYADYRRRGIAIGSGPMESFHRTASQARLKIPGARWTVETSQAILNLRLMNLAGNAERFWSRPGIAEHLTEAFVPS